MQLFGLIKSKDQVSVNVENLRSDVVHTFWSTGNHKTPNQEGNSNNYTNKNTF